DPPQLVRGPLEVATVSRAIEAFEDPIRVFGCIRMSIPVSREEHRCSVKVDLPEGPTREPLSLRDFDQRERTRARFSADQHFNHESRLVRPLDELDVLLLVEHALTHEGRTQIPQRVVDWFLW